MCAAVCSDVDDLKGEKDGVKSLELSSALKDQINRILNMYEGTHDFHNFSAKVT